MSNEKVRLSYCEHCGSEKIEEVGCDIYPTDNDVISELQYWCHDCGKWSSALNSIRKGEFTLNLDILKDKGKQDE